MKKLLLIAVFCFTCIYSSAQNENASYIYCKIVGTQKFLSHKVTVEIDYGQAKKFGEKQKLRDEDGKPVTFNSMIDAMNWMGSKGWEFCQAYVITTQNQSVCHWLLKLNTSKLSEEDIEEIKSDFNTGKNKK